MNKVLADKQMINMQEVDAVHGAKPEAEERQFVDVTLMEVPKVVMQDHATGQTTEISPVRTAVMTEVSSIDDQLEAFGKYCQNCRHFNKHFGQMEIKRMMGGEPHEKAIIQEMRVRLELDSEVDDIAEMAMVYHSPADQFIAEMGACMALTGLMAGTALMHPSQNGCPKEVPGIDGKPLPLPFMYEARDPEQARQDAAVRDSLLFKAAGLSK